MADGTPVTAAVGDGGLAPSDPGAVEVSEAEMICPSEGRLATLERGGDTGRSRESRRGALERGGDRPAGSRGLGWATLCSWAVDWASLSPFHSFGLEGGCRPSWVRLPNMYLRF